MLHEILLSLLGFTGDVIVQNNKNSTFHVKPGFDKFSEAETEQINNLVPIGWYYTQINKYLSKYKPNWVGIKNISVYKSAISIGIQDFVEEYTQAVVSIEQMILVEGPMPLNYIINYFHKYTLVFPVVYEILLKIENKKKQLLGTQILQFILSYDTGIVVVKEVLQRIQEKVQLVFLKQCLGWMLFGELLDSGCGKEFFIRQADIEKNHINPAFQSKRQSNDNSLLHHVSSQLNEAYGYTKQHVFETEINNVDTNGTHSYAHASLPLNWHNSYTLEYDMIPTSLISTTLATKILFAGKAVKLLKHMNATDGNPSDEQHETQSINAIFNYFISNNNTTCKPTSIPMTNNKANPSVSNIKSDNIVFDDYAQNCGYNRDAVQHFSTYYNEICEVISNHSGSGNEYMLIELLNRLFMNVHDVISSQLWWYLKTKYHFIKYMSSIRNTYLLGKGEFFQNILDQVLTVIHTSHSKRDIHQSNHLLAFEVLDNVAKLLELDHQHDISLKNVFKLTLTNPIQLSLYSFHKKDVTDKVYLLNGSAHIVYKISKEQPKDIANPQAMVDHGMLDLVHNPHETPANKLHLQINNLWEQCISNDNMKNKDGFIGCKGKAVQPHAKTVDAATINKTDSYSYKAGSLWCGDKKSLSKGFRITLRCSFSTVVQEHQALGILNAKHPLFNSCSPISTTTKLNMDSVDFDWNSLDCVMLGSTSVCIHNNQISDVTAYASVTPSTARRDTQHRDHLSNELENMSISHVRNNISISLALYGYLVTDIAEYGELGNSESVASTSVLHYFLKLSIYPPPSGVVPLTQCAYYEVVDVGDANTSMLTSKQLQLNDIWQLDIDYSRALRRNHGVNSTSSIYSASPTIGSGSGSGIVYTLNANIEKGVSTTDPSKSVASVGGPDGEKKGISVEVDINQVVHLSNGYGVIGVIGSCLNYHDSTAGDGNKHEVTKRAELQYLQIYLLQLHVNCTDIVSTYPVATMVSSTKHPETYSLISKIITQYHRWMHVKLELQLPSLYQILFDSTVLVSYQRMFSLLMKIRLVIHALERLWKIKDIDTEMEPNEDSNSENHTTSGSIVNNALTYNRTFCRVRYAMHFFVSNLFYYLQIDVIDVEYHAFLNGISDENIDFSTVLMLHKKYLTNILINSMIDNVQIQDNISYILHLCLRFLTICDILLNKYTKIESQNVPVNAYANEMLLIPLSEFDAIYEEFIWQVILLVQMMRKLDNLNKGFLFRLDFNGYLTNLTISKHMKK